MKKKNVEGLWDAKNAKKPSIQCIRDDSIDLRRVYMLSYIPAGFWSRLITRLLADEHLPALIQQFFSLSISDAWEPQELAELLDNGAEWLLWQTGLELRFLGHTLFSVKEFLPLAEIRDVNYHQMTIRYQLEQTWIKMLPQQHAIIELFLPGIQLVISPQATGKGALLMASKQVLVALCHFLSEFLVQLNFRPHLTSLS